MNTSLNDFINFSGRCVVVTGGSGVIGAGIAERFAEAGATVFIHYRSNRESAQAIQQKIQQTGAIAELLQADLTDKQQVSTMFKEAADKTGQIDVLINNAGNYPVSGIEQLAESEWDDVINNNLKATFLCTQAVLDYMKPAGKGSIVNISSIESENPAPMHSHYSSAKAGLNMFTRAIAKETGEYNIRCNAVLPGLIWREGIEEMWPEGVEPWLATVPLKRMGLAEDVANACLFLSSDAANWITGTELRVDGGIMSNRVF